MRGELTIAAFCGAASGTLITSRRKRAVFGSSIGAVRAAGQLLGRAHARRAGDVDVDVRPCRSDRSRPCACASRGRSARWRRTSGSSMSVMSKMRMPRSAILADRLGHALDAAVDAAGLAFARHEQQVLVDRDVALRRRADVGHAPAPASPGSRCRRSGSRCSCPGSTYLPVNARSELRRRRGTSSAAASSTPAACSTRPAPASQRPAVRPTRGSGRRRASPTRSASTGAGITAGGGGGGGGGGPPRPPSAATAGGGAGAAASPAARWRRRRAASPAAAAAAARRRRGRRRGAAGGVGAGARRPRAAAGRRRRRRRATSGPQRARTISRRRPRRPNDQ